MFNIASFIVPFFSKAQDEGVGLGMLDVRTRGPYTKSGHYRKPGPETSTPVRGSWAPVAGETQDVGNEGIVSLGDITVWTNERLEVPDEFTETPGVVLHAGGDVYGLYARQNWTYAQGWQYLGRTLRRNEGV